MGSEPSCESDSDNKIDEATKQRVLDALSKLSVEDVRILLEEMEAQAGRSDPTTKS